MSDLIDRQAAIDEVCLSWCARTNDECVHISDIEIGCFWCDGCDDVKSLKELPSIDMEAIRKMYSPIKCGECKWCELVDGDYMCRNPRSYVVATAVDYGCVLAERKENDA